MGLCALAMMFAPACASTPTEVEEPETVAEPDPPPKKKAKPRCEALTEGCVAGAETQAKVAKSEMVFIPPAGWVYAQEEQMTVTRAKEGGGVLGMASFELGDSENKAREAQFTKLVDELGLNVPEKFKKKYVPNWTKPDATRKAGDLEVRLWQAEDAKRDGEPGFLLVLLSDEPGGKKVMGVAFAPKKDDASVEAISKSLETLGPGSYQ